VPSARAALARLAGAWHGHPSRALTLVGITGTNGKTTTSYLVEALLRARGFATGVIGTVQYVVGAERRPAGQTTPEALELQALLAEMREAGVRGVAMEVSSHALALARVDGLAAGNAGGEVIIDGDRRPIADDDAIIVPAGARHNVVNTGSAPLQLYTLYAPPEHRDGVVHPTKADADASDEHFDGTTSE